MDDSVALALARARCRRGLTITGKADGFGAQLMAILSGIAFCRHEQIPYVHSPIEHILPVGTFASDFDHRVPEANRLIDSVIAGLGIATHVPNPRAELHMHDLVNADPDAYYCPEFVRWLAGSYREPAPSLYDRQATNIALHVRRGDIEEGDPSRWVDMQEYSTQMCRLRAVHPDAHFHVFSWLDPCDDLVDDDVTVHCGEHGGDFLEVFNCFVHSDVLVIGASCLSMGAALFNTGTVIAPTTHRARTNWAGHELPSRWYR